VGEFLSRALALRLRSVPLLSSCTLRRANILLRPHCSPFSVSAAVRTLVERYRIRGGFSMTGVITDAAIYDSSTRCGIRWAWAMHSCAFQPADGDAEDIIRNIQRNDRVVLWG